MDSQRNKAICVGIKCHSESLGVEKKTLESNTFRFIRTQRYNEKLLSHQNYINTHVFSIDNVSAKRFVALFVDNHKLNVCHEYARDQQLFREWAFGEIQTMTLASRMTLIDNTVLNKKAGFVMLVEVSGWGRTTPDPFKLLCFGGNTWKSNDLHRVVIRKLSMDDLEVNVCMSGLEDNTLQLTCVDNEAGDVALLIGIIDISKALNIEFTFGLETSTNNIVKQTTQKTYVSVSYYFK